MLTYIREDADNKIDELQKLGIPIYSISRLDTFDTCKYKFLKTYIIPEQRVTNNIYSILGGKVHNLIEKKCNYKRNNKVIDFDIEKELVECYKQSELSGYSFINNKIKDKWLYDIIHFYNNSNFYKNNIIENELRFVLDLDGIWMQGFIDAIVDNGDNTVSIIDWKTSSMFKSEDIVKKGRQLVLYKIALEAAGTSVSHSYWNMLKYVNIKWNNKSGNITNRNCERTEIIDKMKNEFTKFLSSNEFSYNEINKLIEKSESVNTFEFLPEILRNKYKIEDYLMEYYVDDDVENETINYIINSVDDITNHKNDDSIFWKPNEIDKSNSFFCSNLCDVNNICDAYKLFMSGNIVDENNDNNLLKKLFG